MIKVSIFKNWDYVCLYLTSCMMGAIELSVTFYGASYFVIVLGHSATTAGIEILPMVVGFVISSIASGKYK